jgi:trehalose 6-phosphate phosphatase
VRPAPATVSGDRPWALDHVDAIVERLCRGRTAIFLDYDGTLTPIVDRPEDARLGGAMREVVGALARRHPLAVVSGRDLDDVRARVGVEEAFYAGSHGFDIVGPGASRHRHPDALAHVATLDQAEAELATRLRDLPGSRVERKAFSLAVHYRLVAAVDLPRLQAAVEAVRATHPALRVQAGKKVFDFQPDVPWHKGRAVMWLMEAVGDEALVPLYVGDDVTDEDAFRTLAERGVTVAVLDAPRPTAAQYRLRDTQGVHELLRALLRRLPAPAADAHPG